MIRNAWAFAADARHWMPLPSSPLPADLRERWLDQAVARMARANLVTDEALLPALRRRGAEILDAAPGGEACVYFPVMEPDALVVRIETLPEDDWRESLRHWARQDGPTTSVEVTPLEHAALSEAHRVMRVDRGDDAVEFGVAFAGIANGVGVVLWAITTQPLLAGQFGGAGEEFFATFEPRSESAVA